MGFRDAKGDHEDGDSKGEGRGGGGQGHRSWEVEGSVVDSIVELFGVSESIIISR